MSVSIEMISFRSERKVTLCLSVSTTIHFPISERNSGASKLTRDGSPERILDRRSGTSLIGISFHRRRSLLASVSNSSAFCPSISSARRRKENLSWKIPEKKTPETVFEDTPTRRRSLQKHLFTLEIRLIDRCFEEKANIRIDR